MKARTPYHMVWALLLGASLASAQVELTDNLAVSGFVDTAYCLLTMVPPLPSPFLWTKWKSTFFSISTLSPERFIFNQTGDTLELEQAYVTYDLGNGLTLNAGRYLSLLGFESDESVTRFTRSLAYDSSQSPSNWHQTTMVYKSLQRRCEA